MWFKEDKVFWFYRLFEKIYYKKRQQHKYPSLFNVNFLDCVILTAWIYEKDASWPNISMYIALIRFSFYLLSERFFSLIFSFNLLYSETIILSSSYLERVSPMLLTRSCISLERWEPDDISYLCWYFFLLFFKIIILDSFFFALYFVFWFFGN
jgi:hypothetical protein